MKNPFLEVWENRKKEQGFSSYDYIYWMTSEKLDDCNAFSFFALLEFFWPTFLVYKNYIFLKEQFSEKRFNELLEQNEKIEFWMNFLLIDPFFENREDREEEAAFLAQSLVEIWQAKLNKDFPNINFTVKYLYDSEAGDYALTFYQTP